MDLRDPLVPKDLQPPLNTSLTVEEWAARCACLEREVDDVRRTLGVLAGGIAHDFNNLLLGILGNVGLALAHFEPGSPGRSYLHEAEKVAFRAADLVSQMLAYSGKGKVFVEVFDLNELVTEMEEPLSESVSTTELEVVLGPEAAGVEGDAAQLRQVVSNLITNAAEALDDRPGKITLRTGVASVDRAFLAETCYETSLGEGRYSWVEVEDTGRGMDAETRKKLFDPFFTTKAPGRGLGMAAVIGIVRGHGGTVRVRSELGAGTTVRVFLPFRETASEDVIVEVGSMRALNRASSSRWTTHLLEREQA